jgi:hypothetical protein
MSDPDYANDNQYWIINNSRIIHAATRKCLTAPSSNSNNIWTLQQCDHKNIKQKFQMKQSELGLTFSTTEVQTLFSRAKMLLKVERDINSYYTNGDYKLTTLFNDNNNLLWLKLNPSDDNRPNNDPSRQYDPFANIITDEFLWKII